MQTQHGLPAISCRDLRKIQDADEAHVIIDVRDEAEYEAGHIEGSIHVPLRELEGNVESLVPDRSSHLIVVGEERGLAPETHGHLQEKGYSKVEFLLGGFDAWCKPAEPDIADLKEDAEMDREIAEDRSGHGEDQDDVEQGTQDEPLM